MTTRSPSPPSTPTPTPTPPLPPKQTTVPPSPMILPVAPSSPLSLSSSSSSIPSLPTAHLTAPPPPNVHINPMVHPPVTILPVSSSISAIVAASMVAPSSTTSQSSAHSKESSSSGISAPTIPTVSRPRGTTKLADTIKKLVVTRRQRKVTIDNSNSSSYSGRPSITGGLPVSPRSDTKASSVPPAGSGRRIPSGIHELILEMVQLAPNSQPLQQLVSLSHSLARTPQGDAHRWRELHARMLADDRKCSCRLDPLPVGHQFRVGDRVRVFRTQQPRLWVMGTVMRVDARGTMTSSAHAGTSTGRLLVEHQAYWRAGQGNNGTIAGRSAVPVRLPSGSTAIAAAMGAPGMMMSPLPNTSSNGTTAATGSTNNSDGYTKMCSWFVISPAHVRLLPSTPSPSSNGSSSGVPSPPLSPSSPRSMESDCLQLLYRAFWHARGPEMIIALARSHAILRLSPPPPSSSSSTSSETKSSDSTSSEATTTAGMPSTISVAIPSQTNTALTTSGLSADAHQLAMKMITHLESWYASIAWQWSAIVARPSVHLCRGDLNVTNVSSEPLWLDARVLPSMIDAIARYQPLSRGMLCGLFFSAVNQLPDDDMESEFSALRALATGEIGQFAHLMHGIARTTMSHAKDALEYLNVLILRGNDNCKLMLSQPSWYKWFAPILTGRAGGPVRDRTSVGMITDSNGIAALRPHRVSTGSFSDAEKSSASYVLQLTLSLVVLLLHRHFTTYAPARTNTKQASATRTALEKPMLQLLTECIDSLEECATWTYDTVTLVRVMLSSLLIRIASGTDKSWHTQPLHASWDALFDVLTVVEEFVFHTAVQPSTGGSRPPSSAARAGGSPPMTPTNHTHTQWKQLGLHVGQDGRCDDSGLLRKVLATIHAMRLDTLHATPSLFPDADERNKLKEIKARMAREVQFYHDALACMLQLDAVTATPLQPTPSSTATATTATATPKHATGGHSAVEAPVKHLASLLRERRSKRGSAVKGSSIFSSRRNTVEDKLTSQLAAAAAQWAIPSATGGSVVVTAVTGMVTTAQESRRSFSSAAEAGEFVRAARASVSGRASIASNAANNATSPTMTRERSSRSSRQSVAASLASPRASTSRPRLFAPNPTTTTTSARGIAVQVAKQPRTGASSAVKSKKPLPIPPSSPSLSSSSVTPSSPTASTSESQPVVLPIALPSLGRHHAPLPKPPRLSQQPATDEPSAVHLTEAATASSSTPTTPVITSTPPTKMVVEEVSVHELNISTPILAPMNDTIDGIAMPILPPISIDDHGGDDEVEFINLADHQPPAPKPPQASSSAVASSSSIDITKVSFPDGMLHDDVLEDDFDSQPLVLQLAAAAHAQAWAHAAKKAAGSPPVATNTHASTTTMAHDDSKDPLSPPARPVRAPWMGPTPSTPVPTTDTSAPTRVIPPPPPRQPTRSPPPAHVVIDPHAPVIVPTTAPSTSSSSLTVHEVPPSLLRATTSHPTTSDRPYEMMAVEDIPPTRASSSSFSVASPNATKKDSHISNTFVPSSKLAAISLLDSPLGFDMPAPRPRRAAAVPAVTVSSLSPSIPSNQQPAALTNDTAATTASTSSPSTSTPTSPANGSNGSNGTIGRASGKVQRLVNGHRRGQSAPLSPPNGPASSTMIPPPVPIDPAAARAAASRRLRSHVRQQSLLALTEDIPSAPAIADWAPDDDILEGAEDDPHNEYTPFNHDSYNSLASSRRTSDNTNGNGMNDAELLVCAECCGPVDAHSFYEHGGAVYCEADFTRLFCTCAECNQPLSESEPHLSFASSSPVDGAAIPETQLLFHPSCFCCFACKSSFFTPSGENSPTKDGTTTPSATGAGNDSKETKREPSTKANKTTPGASSNSSSASSASTISDSAAEATVISLTGTAMSIPTDIISSPMLLHGRHLYCQYDYLRLFGFECFHCKLPIHGPLLQAASRHYHQACFQCVGPCGRPLGRSPQISSTQVNGTWPAPMTTDDAPLSFRALSSHDVLHLRLLHRRPHDTSPVASAASSAASSTTSSPAASRSPSPTRSNGNGNSAAVNTTSVPSVTNSNTNYESVNDIMSEEHLQRSEGEVFCTDCYAELFRVDCFVCGLDTGGDGLRIGAASFHSACYHCVICHEAERIADSSSSAFSSSASSNASIDSNSDTSVPLWSRDRVTQWLTDRCHEWSLDSFESHGITARFSRVDGPQLLRLRAADLRARISDPAIVHRLATAIRALRQASKARVTPLTAVTGRQRRMNATVIAPTSLVQKPLQVGYDRRLYCTQHIIDLL